MSAVAAAASKGNGKTRSWADVARRMASSIAEETVPAAAAEVPSPEASIPATKAATNLESESKGTAPPNADKSAWKTVAGRFATAFADYEEDCLRPGPRGSAQCPCNGEVLIMFGNYGWIGTMDWIDHPFASRNSGRIYVHRFDVANGVTLVEGDKVKFNLYVDEKGLGAEDVHLQGYSGIVAQHGASQTPASQIVHLSAKKMGPEAFDPDVAEYVPIMQRLKQASASPCPYEPSPTISTKSPASCAMKFNAHYWQTSDSEDSDSDFETDDEAVGDKVPRKRMDGSAFFSLGLSGLDDTESKENTNKAPPSPPPGLDKRPPQGLLPLFRAPPGLTLP